ncbi:uncharacterized protein LOC128863184 isoform X1 [Anastrepha ludens]|uniref:uncharacterized protein LOC128863184 isoform X1 n=1 Tax=Anastrepha ludens TaxID=28586 RepID=UPI0023B1741F|nr:uncharacterized protein LOC128863184 isoform X1 [Anastrepha ludens]XP_053958161.1 uncharacterized protein LOC128863184 isoform X1 [Anastrepha ludens]XP_053958162.1 uncharacterized protein LOC128863184 isoform X1 [Anastrepha ludens]XP_053958163.1 uncharacterized protein LOC128863184 isoform X1 [Anastrepha ludens]XP_053958164.1 uncharacterized protein LOC128863184 isoform X1 [Anastrepha ludens]
MAAATVATHIVKVSVPPPAVLARVTEGANTPEFEGKTDKSYSRLTQAATEITTTIFSSNSNVKRVLEDDCPESLTSDLPIFSATSTSLMSTPSLPAIRKTPKHTRTLRPTLPSEKILHSPPADMYESSNIDGDEEDGEGVSVINRHVSIQLVDNSTQTDILSEEGQLIGNTKLETIAEGQGEHLLQMELLTSNNIEQRYKLIGIPEKGEKYKIVATERECGGESERGEDESHMLYREFKVLNTESALELENSPDIEASCELQARERLIDLESSGCTCNAVTQFNYSGEETTANCTYQERIIDYDNFRIIEHVIDCSHEGYCKHSSKMHCTRPWEDADTENIDERKELNFACRELVAFIGESYQIIDNANSMMKTQEQSNNMATVRTPILESTCPLKDLEEEGIYCAQNDSAGHLICDSQAPIPFNHSVAEVIDNNNNKGRTKVGLRNNYPSGASKSISTTISTTSSVSNPIDPNAKTDKRGQKQEQLMAKVQLPTPSLVVKALKSKLTPLAPSFHPARKKHSPTSSTTAATSSVFAHEQTAIYFQQQPQPPKEQQQRLQHTTTTTMLHTMSLLQHLQMQQEQQQKPQVSPILQQNYSKNSFHQQQNVQSLPQNLQQAYNFVASSSDHQQHCAHHGNSLGVLPHIPLHSSSGPAAVAAPTLTTNALPMPVSNPPQGSHLYPVQVISLASPATATGESNSNIDVSQQQQSNTASSIVAAVGNGVTTWPLLEAAPLFIDTNGEIRTFCPAHGLPTLNTTVVGAASSNGVSFNHSHGNIAQHPSVPRYQHSLHHQTQQFSSTPSASSPSIMAAAIPAGSINAANRLLLQQQTQMKNQNQNQNHHQQQIQHPSFQSHYQHQQQQQKQQQLESSTALQISGKGKLYRGPTAVQMVSQNRPAPIPVPVQVPQGQVMQQYVNESGTFAHVVLSPQYQQLHASQGHIHAPFLTSNGTSHFYSPLPAGFPAGTGSGPAHFHALSSGHVQPQQPPQQQQAPTAQHQQTSSLQPLSHSPSPPNSYHKDERTQRQHTKLLRKLEKQRELNSGMSTPTHSPSPRRNDLNGHHNHSLATTNNSSDGNGSNTHNYATAISGMLTSAPTTASSSVTTTNNSNNSSIGSNYNLQNKNQNQYHVSKQPSLSQQILNNHSFHSRRTPQKNDCVPVNAHQLNNINGEAFACITSSVNTSDGGMEGIPNAVEDEEDFQSLIIEQLSAIQKPDVINLTSRSAKIIWEAPVITDPHINTRELRYNVLFSDRAKECKYKSLYKGESYDCIVQDLQPGQVYVVRLQVHYEKLQGSASDPTEFTTPPCVPDQPAPPKLVMRTKNSLHLRWTNPLSNGSPIQHYLLEYDEGKTGLPATYRSARQNTGSEVLHFVEATKTKGKHYTLTKLQPSTVYNFRLAAINEVGASLFSSICSYSTSSNPPSAPKPPKLQSSSSSSLRLWWERRPQDSDYVLQILDRESGHGYLNAFNGPDCVHECCQLRRATSYQFRLRAENEAGCSPWSNEVTFQTSPEKPGKPGKPHVKGKIHGTHFRTRWDPPTDRGGAEILRYFLEITSGTKFERIYSGTDTETTCDRLQPGTTYQLRTSCEGPAGLSPYSDVAHITSEAIVPAAPPPPYYDNPPGPYATVLRLDKPDYNGGAPVLEFEVQMRRPLDVHFDIENKTNEYSIIYRGRDTYCVVKDLQPGCPYEVQVRAINRIGAGAWSPWFRFSAAAAPPNAPHNIKVVVKSATHLFLNWQEPDCNGAPILEYHLESVTGRNESNSGLEETSEMPAYQTCYQGVQTSVDLRNLLPFTVYYFRVNANNTAGVGKWSTSINARTPAAAPAAPQIKDCEFTATEVSLNWTEPECNGAAITAYVIEYAEGSITTPNTNPSYTVTGLMSETTYKFRLQAINSIGPGPFSAYAKLTTLPSPPAPPALECTGVGHNFIKLKWADGKNLDFTKYYVEMFVQRAKEFQIVYSGTNCMCKVNKLQERTSYTFRIYASTDRAGIGDYSNEYTFSTTPTLPSSIKAPRVAMEGAAACLLTHGASGAGGFIPSGMLAETHTSFIAGLGNLSLGVPLTLEWQNSKNTFNDRVEYLLQYAIGKDGDYKRIYRGAETKFTIENLEPGTMYQFRVCPIRVTSSGEDLVGQYTSAFRYQVPHLASLDDIDSSLLGNMSSVFGGAAGANNNGNASMGCHGHSHLAHHVHGLHTHHSHSHTHHNSRQSASGLHHRSVSASAASPNGCSGNGGINGNGSSNIGGNTILIGPNAIGLIPLGTAMANELAAVGFASCDDPLHHHHHHHHQFHGGNVTAGAEPEVAASTAASFLAATANSLLPNNALLAHASISANHVQNGAVRRCMSKIATLYTNRKRFTDQEKAILFMICFLFFTFLFATLVKTLMR